MKKFCAIVLILVTVFVAVGVVTASFAVASDEAPTPEVKNLSMTEEYADNLFLTKNPFADETYLGLSMRDVWEIQNALRNEGYDVKPDGMYEIATDSAVRMYQAKHGLVVDGIAGIKTQQTLGLEGKLQNYGFDFLFAPLAGTGTNIRVTLSKAFSKTTVYRWNDKTGWETMLEAESMVGAPGHETPSGDFQILDACEEGFSKNGKTYKYMLTFYVPDGDWGKAYGFHTVALDADGNALQRVENQEYRHVTAGCVRNNVDAAKWLYENVPVGSDVRIY